MDVQSFLITFREALEAILIVGVILTYLKRIGQTEWNKWVWVGVILALGASYGVALVFQTVLTGFSTMGSQNYLKIGIMLVSCGLLSHMVLFMSQQSRNLQGKVEHKISTILTVGGALNMILHSFLVVVREGVETVFFFAAITGGDIQKALQSWGALIGLILAVIVGYLFFKGTKKIQLKTFFRITGVFLMMIAGGLLVQAVGIMQDIGMIGSVFRTPGGEIGEIYNLTAIMPEHPLDEVQYIRDTGEHPLINGQVGIFFKAFLGYSQNPSVEEFLLYWAFYLMIVILLGLQKKRSENIRAANQQ
ncbi:FTR1 family protein [Paenibacillus sp. N4]|uniref:FTR1 family iron permease n=1 Tax=Paenibacillus vietnamensis TaxID=2590547 RepID=UPI001CD17A59|nr:FTR1 family protein [Paenibacillus vietnamensis]MCA0753557.1 FTR1 family protein [Paenibacillus vietnamensis]